METRGRSTTVLCVSAETPVHGSKQQLIERIYEVIEAKGVWIPYGEVKRVLDARIAHWNRQTGAAAVSDESEIPSPPTLENQT